MGVALWILKLPEVEKTMEFVLMFDKLFDCLNVSSLSAGKNAFKSPCITLQEISGSRCTLMKMPH